MTNMTDDTTDVQPLTKRDMTHIKELKHLAEQLKHDNLLYGSALDGMAAGVEESVRKVAESDIDAKIAAADEEVAQGAAEVIRAQFDELAGTEAELDADDAEEDALLAGDEGEPADPSL